MNHRHPSAALEEKLGEHHPLHPRAQIRQVPTGLHQILPALTAPLSERPIPLQVQLKGSSANRLDVSGESKPERRVVPSDAPEAKAVA